MPTTDELDARLAVVERHLGITPPSIAPPPAPQPPEAPSGLAVIIGPDSRPSLTWDPAPGVTAWEVHDLANTAVTLQATVTEPRSVRSPLKAGQRRRYAIVAVGPGGRSPMSDAVDVPPAPGGSTTSPTPVPSTGTARYPGDIVGKNWYLTLPTGAQGSPDTVKQPALATCSSKYFELTPARDGVIFRAWHGGVTTKNSPNPRSELRECNPDGSLAKWSAARGRHSMEVVGQVNRLTKVRPHVVLWQVHGGSDDVCVFRLEGASLWITDGDNPHGHLVTDQFQLGQRYELKGEIVNGKARFWYNGQPVNYELATSDPGCYFKAGCYLQSNPKSAPGESTDEYAEVILHSATVEHA